LPGPAGHLLVRVGAGVVFDDFCAWAASEGLWGPENLSLIPGEVGASAVQNIGAYGVEAKDIIDTVHAFDLTTRTFVDIPCADCAHGYRTSRFKTEWKGRYIITAVTFRLSAVPQPKLDYGGVRKALEARFLDSACGSARNDKKQILSTKPEDCTAALSTKPEGGVSTNAEDSVNVISTRAEDRATVISTKAEDRVEKSLTAQMVRETVIAIREQKLPDPAKIGSAGSFFCNPVIERAHFERIVSTARKDNGPDYEVPHYDVGNLVKVPAAWMIEQCGFKGEREGGAQIYPKQPLVIVNATGEATPDEIIALERRVIDTIRGKYGVQLHPEVEHVGMQEAENQRDK
jgi:UDP-N-acetylenolpyruvoylglucosamine reductase